MKTAKIGVNSAKTGKILGKNRCKSIKMSKIWNKMGNTMPVVVFNRNNMKNYGDPQPKC